MGRTDELIDPWRDRISNLCVRTGSYAKQLVVVFETPSLCLYLSRNQARFVREALDKCIAEIDALERSEHGRTNSNEQSSSEPETVTVAGFIRPKRPDE